jgi:hypothetical protein
MGKCASLLELSLPAPPQGEVAAPPAIRARMALPEPGAPEKPSPPTLRISFGPGVLVSPGGFAASAALDVGLAWMPSDHVGAAAFASIPLTRPRVTGDAGSADLAALLVGGGMRFLFATRASTWAPSADAGVAAVRLVLTATAGPGYRAADASAWTAAPFARVSLAFASTPMLRFRADLLTGIVTQSVAVKLAKQEVATFGRPLVLASAGVDFGWF